MDIETRHLPRSPRDQLGGLVYLPRLLDKIRLHLRGQLDEDYRENFGADDALDGMLASFLLLTHAAIIERVSEGGSDDEILAWCFAKGLRPNEAQIFIWNAFAEKLGWHDGAARTVTRVNARLGAAGRLKTIFDCIDADEGRLQPAA